MHSRNLSLYATSSEFIPPEPAPDRAQLGRHISQSTSPRQRGEDCLLVSASPPFLRKHRNLPHWNGKTELGVGTDGSMLVAWVLSIRWGKSEQFTPWARSVAKALLDRHRPLLAIFGHNTILLPTTQTREGRASPLGKKMEKQHPVPRASLWGAYKLDSRNRRHFLDLFQEKPFSGHTSSQIPISKLSRHCPYL